MPLKIIGAGFGRTGTNSLRLALNMLGAGPCYHMHEVKHNPGHHRRWHEIANGENPDWEALFGGYQAAVDWPSTHYWTQLLDQYPDSKVILTIRDPEEWFRSFSNTIHKAIHLDIPEDLEEDKKLHRLMVYKIIAEETFKGNSADKDFAIRVFQQRTADVKNYVRPDRLLVYDVREGWAPLCLFLGVPEPEVPFPKTNSTADFISSTPDAFKAQMKAE